MWGSSQELYVPYRLTTGAIDWIVTWGSSQELYVFLYLYQCKVEHLDALQHNSMTNSEMEMCMWS